MGAEHAALRSKPEATLFFKVFPFGGGLKGAEQAASWGAEEAARRH